MINQYLNPLAAPHQGEVELLHELIIESIQIIGVEMGYLRREMVNRDPLFGESTISNFKELRRIEMEVMDITGFDGSEDLFEKFGLVHEDTAAFRVSNRRFRDEFAQDNLTKPVSGDLIWLPTNNSLWEITRVLEDENFKRFGASYSWIMKCKLFRFSHEQIESTDPVVSNIDESISSTDYDTLRQSLGIADAQYLDETEFIQEENERLNVDFDPTSPFSGKPFGG